MVSKEGKCGGIHINLLIGIRQGVKVDVGLELIISTLSYAKKDPIIGNITECQILIYTSYENHTKYRCAQWPKIFGMVLI